MVGTSGAMREAGSLTAAGTGRAVALALGEVVVVSDDGDDPFGGDSGSEGPCTDPCGCQSHGSSGQNGGDGGGTNGAGVVPTVEPEESEAQVPQVPAAAARARVPLGRAPALEPARQGIVAAIRLLPGR